MVLPRFFARPHGVGAPANVYMFTPRSLARHVKTLCTDPEYFVARLRVMVYQFLHPGAPWLTSRSIQVLAAHLHKPMVGLEWGSGQSTIWLARRLGKLVSIEHHASWHTRISEALKRKGIDNVDYRLLSSDSHDNPYVLVIHQFPNEYFDVILVDGQCRDQCLEAAVSKIKPGGLIVLDNADQGYSTPALRDLKCHSTSNGIWRTDLFWKNAVD